MIFSYLRKNTNSIIVGKFNSGLMNIEENWATEYWGHQLKWRKEETVFSGTNTFYYQCNQI